MKSPIDFLKGNARVFKTVDALVGVVFYVLLFSSSRTCCAFVAPRHRFTPSLTHLSSSPHDGEPRRRQHLRSCFSKSLQTFSNEKLSPWQPLTAKSDDDKEFESVEPSASANAKRADRTLSTNGARNDTNAGPLQEISHKLEILFNKTESILPAPLRSAAVALSNATQTFTTWLQSIRWYVATFTAGVVLAVTALVVPLTHDIQTLTQPVTLFETILSDLEAAYVEPVNVETLFATGVNAMLASLDPYTEFEGREEAASVAEGIEGRYGGVGLVIAGAPTDAAATKTGTQKDDQASDGDDSAIQKRIDKLSKQGVRVVSALEGYAFDYGLRVGDKLVQVDDMEILSASSKSNNNEQSQEGLPTNLDQVRNHLRGEPGTLVTIQFERDGVEGVQSVTMPRSVVRLRDVKLATLLGNPADGIGYIQLSGFAADAGREVRNAILALQRAAEDASHKERSLQGLVLDLRGNPGGLLTSAVDVASLLVPKGSDIVSAKGRGFPSIIYRSRVDPILDTSSTKLTVLVNGNTASAAEIVSGAVQDLDVGVIVGADRTFGKGLVQNVEELPYNTALKFTVAKYYTPSGRCIQGINYKEGTKGENDGKFVATAVAEKDRSTYSTRLGRTVRDGGGIEADYKVPGQKASALEITLMRSGLLNDFAAEWSKKNELTNHFSVDEDTYKAFQAFVSEKQKSGELQLEELYGKPLQDLKQALKASGYRGSEKSVEQLQARIVRDIQNDFDKYRAEIKEDISQSILARYLPESMLIERGVRKDPQVKAAVELMTSRNKFDKLLAKGGTTERVTDPVAAAAAKLSVSADEEREEGFRSSLSW